MLTLQPKLVCHKICKYVHVISMAVISTPSFATQPGIFIKVTYGFLESLGLFIRLMHYMTFIIGLTFCLGSILRYVQHRTNPSQTPIYQAISLGSLGIILLLLPFVTQKAIDPTTPSKIKYRLTKYNIVHRY